MNVSAVYIDLEYYSYAVPLRVRYQLASNYLSLFISEWMKERGLDLGPFNRFVFVEGSQVDMQVVGDRALAVRISETVRISGSPFAPERQLVPVVEIHNYFVGRYLEGFRRVDDYFGLSLSESLAEAITLNFSKSYAYEKPIAGCGRGNEKLKLFHRYTMDAYQLIAVENHGKADGLASEYMLMELTPDPFKVNYHVSSITIDGRRIFIANSTGSEVVVREV
ncbi:hypothetical protein [Stenotrophomonas sp. NA06056]|uniref:hypothetical protein n=1 Tax=Stenotrophomonas sp. NA06056 TaxID=2742129 RepID=UPI001588B926|nr:hypothetical protein [Stenotrophomonas sp. NA06056]QKW58558.1 hypothetical protein HUT07_18840 [Stenotrophomonas sp. NA06056]